MDGILDRNIEDLAQAIILQAAEDYRIALWILKQKPDTKSPAAENDSGRTGYNDSGNLNKAIQQS